MSNGGILSGLTTIPAQQFGYAIMEYRYANHQFNAGDLGKTLALVYNTAAGFWLPHKAQCYFRWGAIISGYNPSTTSTVVITPRSGVTIRVSGITGTLTRLNVQPKAQFMLLKEDDANSWIATGSGIY